MKESIIHHATSAYQYFQREESSKVREYLQNNGLEASFGNVAKELSARWKSLSDTSKQKYLDLHQKDKERYEQESEARDAEVEAAQAAKRAQRDGEVDGPRDRKELVPKVEKKERHIRTDEELTEEELARKRARLAQRAEAKAARQEKEAEIERQAQAHREVAAKQAQARLQFLLKQSDIFKHFGAKVEKKSDDGAGTPMKPNRSDSLKSPAKHHMRERAESESRDEEDLKEEEEEHTFLLQQPSIITGGTLRPYQLEGLNWMIRLQENGVNGVLADEMGLGKTFQSISIIAYMREFRKVNGPHLVLIPKSTLSNWMNEFARFCPAIRPVRFHGNKEEREHLINTVLKPGTKEEEREWDVLITTYEMANMEKNTLSKFAWKYLIIDEAHRLKNEASIFSQTVRQFNTMYRLLLTGTPLQNNLHELWALLNYLLPDIFSSSEQFDEWFNLDVDDSEAKQRMISQLHKILRPFMLRRLKSDVEKTLPPKKETILFTGMSAVQKNLYRQILLRDIDTINNANPKNSGRTAILNIVMQLRKCCNHPYLFPNVEDRTLDPLGEHVIENCGKTVLLDKLLRKLKERGHRVLIFSQMTRALDILEDVMLMRGHSYCRIDGDTSYEDREDMIEEYNRPGSEKFVFLLSTRAGGLGINLQTADTCILYDSDWNPQADLQAQDRCHRIGQKKQVHIYRLVTENSIEEKVVERAQKKLKLDAMVVQQGRLESQDKKMSTSELLDALRFGADKVFRSKDSEITDDDIDAILERGEKKTQELVGKLEDADKGDLMDFKLDGGLATQKFEGVDYAEKRNRAQGAIIPAHLLLDVGKRERKKVQIFGATYKVAEKKKKKKVPKHLRLPKHLVLPKQMMPWHFYEVELLEEIQEEEERLWRKMVEQDKDPKTEEGKATVQVLDADLQAEKAKLLAEGFGTWVKQDLMTFVRAAAKYGRTDYVNISKDVRKDPEDVKAYSKAFWEKGEDFFEEEEWNKMVGSIERGEGKIAEWKRIQEAATKFLSSFEDPWNQLTFQHVTPTGTGKSFTPEEDRLLLCLAKKCGFGNWDKLYMAVRRVGALRFGYYVRALSEEELGKRVELLMRTCEREMTEGERKVAQQREKDEKDRQLELSRLEKEMANHQEKLKDMHKNLEALAHQLSEAAKKREEYKEKGPSQADISKFLKPLNLPTLKSFKPILKKTEGNEKVEWKEKAENVNGKVSPAKETIKSTDAGSNSEKNKKGDGKKKSPKRKQPENSKGESETSPKSKPKKSLAPEQKDGTAPKSKKNSASSTNVSEKKANKKPKINGSMKSSGGKIQGTLDIMWKGTNFPDEYLPNLVQLMKEAGTDGLQKIVDSMHASLSGKFSKNCLRQKIPEVAVKERREPSTRIVWYIKPEFEKYLQMPTVPLPQPKTGAASSGDGPSKGTPKKPAGSGEKTPNKGPAETNIKGREPTKFPDKFLPNLVQFLKEAGADGLQKIVDTMHSALGNNATKTAISRAISLVAVKEKREPSTKVIWYIKPDFEKYLEMPKALVLPQAAILSQPGKSSSKKPKKASSAPKKVTPAKKSSATKPKGSNSASMKDLRDKVHELEVRLGIRASGTKMPSAKKKLSPTSKVKASSTPTANDTQSPDSQRLNDSDSKENMQSNVSNANASKSATSASKATKKRKLVLGEQGAETKKQKSPAGPKKKAESQSADPSQKQISPARKKTPLKKPPTPRSAFIIWSSVHKNEIMKTNPGKSLMDLADILQNKWTAMSHEERATWDKKHEAEKKKYQGLLEKYKKSKQTIS